MMNEARIGVGLQGLAQADGRLPARRRLRPRAAAGPRRHRRRRTPTPPADPLIVHPDVRRMLMDQKAFVEGGRAFALLGRDA